MKIKGAIFDLDGTLIDSMPLWDSVGDVYLTRKNITPPNNFREIVKEMSTLQTAQYLKSEYTFEETIDEIINEINILVEDNYKYEVPLKQHVMTVLQDLKQNGVKMCIATANSFELFEPTLKRLEIFEYFDFIITCTDVGLGKDDPTIFNTALEKLGTSIEETFVFEDAIHAIITAKNAGFNVIGVYDESAQSDTREIKTIANHYIHTFDELKDIII